VMTDTDREIVSGATEMAELSAPAPVLKPSSKPPKQKDVNIIKVDVLPWFPKAYIEKTQRRASLSRDSNRGNMSVDLTVIRAYRGPIERLHLLMNDPRESKLGVLVTVIIMVCIVVSTTTFCLESMPEFHEYRDECQKCKPVYDVDTIDGMSAPTWRAQWTDTCTDCEPKSKNIFRDIEYIVCMIFTAEYGLKVLTCWATASIGEQEKEKKTQQEEGQVVGIITAIGAAISTTRRTLLGPTLTKYTNRMIGYIFFDALNVIDVLVIVPCWLSYLPLNLTFLRLLRLLRVLRIIRLSKLSKHIIQLSEGMLTFVDVFKKSTMALLILVIYTMFLMVLMASIVFTCEAGEWDPGTGRFKRRALYYLSDDEDSPFESIPATFWWTLVTFTTVGYGDMSPTTPFGRFWGVVAMYLGILFIAMPITIIGTQFQELYDRQREKYQKEREEWLNAGRVLLKHLFSVDDDPLMEGFQRWIQLVRKQQKNENDVKLIIREHQDELATSLRKDMQELKDLVATLKKP